jgi:predicted RNA binding protein YcfA (HicA-like mRNA interferase family)
MNINKEINKIQKEVSYKLDEVVIGQTDEFQKKTFETFRPLIDTIQRGIDTLYTEPKLTLEEFENIIDPLVNIFTLIALTYEDAIMTIAEEVIESQRLKQTHKEIFEKHLIEPLTHLHVPPHRARREFEKAQHSFFIKGTRHMNLTMCELVKEVCEIMAMQIQAIIDYAESNRIIFEEEEPEVDTTSQDNNNMTKITNLKDMINLVESKGYQKVRQKGSHQIYQNQRGETTVIPAHNKDFHRGLGYRIQKQVKK